MDYIKNTENDTLKYQNPNYSNCNISSDVEIINNDFTINVIIYPNPLNKNLIIEVFNIKVNTLLELYNSFGQLKDTYILTTTKTEIVLSDVLGKEIILFNDYLPSGNHEISINLYDLQLSNGMYFVKLITDKFQKVVPLCRIIK